MLFVDFLFFGVDFWYVLQTQDFCYAGGCLWILELSSGFLEKLGSLGSLGIVRFLR